jgi:hypothetical protein
MIMGSFWIVIGAFVVVFFMFRRSIENRRQSQSTRSSAPVQPSAAPWMAVQADVSPVWMSSQADLLPLKKTTIFLAVPLDQARQRLGRTAEWVIGRNMGIFYGQHRYDVAIRGDTIVIDGPFGYKKWQLQTLVTLYVTPQGTALHVVSRLDKATALLAGLLFSTFLIAGGFMVGPIFPIMALLLLYSVAVFSVKYEANIITDHCIRSIIGSPQG